MLWVLIRSSLLNYKCLDEALLMSNDNLGLGGEIKIKILCGYPSYLGLWNELLNYYSLLIQQMTNW